MALTNKKVLVTGGAGYIGSVLVSKLLSKDYKVTVLDRLIFGGESLIQHLNNKSFTFIKGDTRDTEAVEKSLKGIDAVIHLAALVGEPACKENPKVTKEINFLATKQIVDLTISKNINKFIFSSTCSNYGISSQEEEATEESKLNPLSLYAETKIASEEYIFSKKSNAFQPTILRLATIFGLSPRIRFNLLVNEFARETALNGKIDIRNKKAWRPYLHAQDIADVFVKVLEADEKKVSNQIFNVVSENVQKEQLANLATKHNPGLNILIQDGGIDDRRDYKVSAQKIKNILDWSPEYSVEQGFVEIVEAIKQGIFPDPYDKKYNAWFDDKVFQDQFKM